MAVEGTNIDFELQEYDVPEASAVDFATTREVELEPSSVAFAGALETTHITLDRPQNIQIFGKEHDSDVDLATVSWDAVEGADYYRVKIDGVEVDQDVEDAEFHDSIRLLANRQYSIQVKAFDGQGGESFWSDVVRDAFYDYEAESWGSSDVTWADQDYIYTGGTLGDVNATWPDEDVEWTSGSVAWSGRALLQEFEKELSRNLDIESEFLKLVARQLERDTDFAGLIQKTSQDFVDGDVTFDAEKLRSLVYLLTGSQNFATEHNFASTEDFIAALDFDGVTRQISVQVLAALLSHDTQMLRSSQKKVNTALDIAGLVEKLLSTDVASLLSHSGDRSVVTRVIQSGQTSFDLDFDFFHTIRQVVLRELNTTGQLEDFDLVKSVDALLDFMFTFDNVTTFLLYADQSFQGQEHKLVSPEDVVRAVSFDGRDTFTAIKSLDGKSLFASELADFAVQKIVSGAASLAVQRLFLTRFVRDAEVDSESALHRLTMLLQNSDLDQSGDITLSPSTSYDAVTDFVGLAHKRTQKERGIRGSNLTFGDDESFAVTSIQDSDITLDMDLRIDLRYNVLRALTPVAVIPRVIARGLRSDQQFDSIATKHTKEFLRSELTFNRLPQEAFKEFVFVRRAIQYFRPGRTFDSSLSRTKKGGGTRSREMGSGQRARSAIARGISFVSRRRT